MPRKLTGRKEHRGGKVIARGPVCEMDLPFGDAPEGGAP